VDSGNLFDLPGIPDEEEEELFEPLALGSGTRIERIVSHGQASPPNGWYDQERDEWVLLLRGSAGLHFEGEPEERVLHPGDWMRIPAHRRHRVAWTDTGTATVWLAIHFDAGR
jgi:cupin 2 domain-containing protein